MAFVSPNGTVQTRATFFSHKESKPTAAKEMNGPKSFVDEDSDIP